ncbi:MAG TPA: serine/threonine-protein kinase, partial [Kofleriaceae bacterium]|nr:serine/threonine-protein kinase [Kofleriaceae bacterium]
IARCRSLEPMVAIEIGRQLAAALEAAHRAGIVHRDLKPENVFLIEDPLVPGGERAKVLDFGIAKLGQSLAVPGTQTGSMTVLGTPRYMSPEQCRSAKNIDHRTDIYALGVMLFELLAGRPPFDGQAVELIAQHLLLPPPVLIELVPDLPPELAALIEQMLEKEPDARLASMEAVLRVLETIAEAAGLAPVRPSAIPGALPQLRLATAQPAAETATTLISLAAPPRAPAPRASGGPRRGVYAGASLFAIALALGTYFLLHGPGDTPVPDALAQGESTPHPLVRPGEPAPTAAGDTAEPAGARGKPARTRGTAAGARAKPTAAAPSFGFLALTAKPACEIYIDGRATGARTPLRELKLPTGKHRITLVDSEHAIQDSFTVVIGPGATERVAKDYSAQLKRDKRNATINPFAGGGR